MLRNKAVAAGLAAFAVIVVSVIAATMLSTAASAPLSDATSCSEWASASPARRSAYAQLYLNEYGALPTGGGSAPDVEASIDKNCNIAFDMAAGDDVKLVQAIRHQY